MDKYHRLQACRNSSLSPAAPQHDHVVPGQQDRLHSALDKNCSKRSFLHSFFLGLEIVFTCPSSVICWSSELVCLLSPFHSNVNSVSVQQEIVRGGHETVPMAMSGFSQIRSDLPTTRTTLIQFPLFFCFVNFI